MLHPCAKDCWQPASPCRHHQPRGPPLFRPELAAPYTPALWRHRQGADRAPLHPRSLPITRSPFPTLHPTPPAPTSCSLPQVVVINKDYKTVGLQFVAAPPITHVNWTWTGSCYDRAAEIVSRVVVAPATTVNVIICDLFDSTAGIMG